METLHFKFEFRGSYLVKPSPDKPVHHDNRAGHKNRSGKEQTEIAVVRCVADHRAQPGGRKSAALQVEIFRHNTGIPGTSGSSDESGNQVRKNGRQNQLPPTQPPAKAVSTASLVKFRRNSRGARDYVKQQIPLRAQQKQKDRCNAQPAAQPHQGQDKYWKQCCGRN